MYVMLQYVMKTRELLNGDLWRILSQTEDLLSDPCANPGDVSETSQLSSMFVIGVLQTSFKSTALRLSISELMAVRESFMKHRTIHLLPGDKGTLLAYVKILLKQSRRITRLDPAKSLVPYRFDPWILVHSTPHKTMRLELGKSNVITFNIYEWVRGVHWPLFPLNLVV